MTYPHHSPAEGVPDFPASIAIAGAWGYIGRKFLDVALAQGAHILLAGIARITCRNARNVRVTVALLAPGPIPDFPALPLSKSGFQCEAYKDCRVGTVSWADFDGITPKVPSPPSGNFTATI